MLENIQLSFFSLLGAHEGKELISHGNSHFYSLQYVTSHGEKLSIRGLEENNSVGLLTSGFNGIIVSLRRHSVCIMTI